jgi:hypothetical protein
VKKYAVAAVAALALAVGASLSMTSAKAADGEAQSSPAGPPQVMKELFIATKNAEMQSVKAFVNGRWTECIETPDPNTPVAVGGLVGPETVPLQGFDSPNCFRGTQIYDGVGDAIATFDAEPDRVVMTPVTTGWM